MFEKKAMITHPFVMGFVMFIIGLIVMAVLTYLGYTSGLVCPATKP